MSKGLMNSVIHNKSWHRAAILSDKSELAARVRGIDLRDGQSECSFSVRNVGARRGLIDSRKQSASFSYPDGESKFDLYRIVEAQDGFAVRIDGKPVGGRDIRIGSKPLTAFRLRS